MTIKDVEKLTGLTVKSIRYYEKKGLINVKRNRGNDYKTYTEKNIHDLKLIKVLRYLNFSVEDISCVMTENSLSEFLIEKIKKLEEESDSCLEKREICKVLIKDYKKSDLIELIDKYSDTIHFLESEDGKK